MNTIQNFEVRASSRINGGETLKLSAKLMLLNGSQVKQIENQNLTRGDK